MAFPSVIEFKRGVRLLQNVSLVTWAIESDMAGDAGGPLTNSPNERRKAALCLREVARDLLEIADAVDPLTEKKPDSAKDTTSTAEPGA